MQDPPRVYSTDDGLIIFEVRMRDRFTGDSFCAQFSAEDEQEAHDAALVVFGNVTVIEVYTWEPDDAA